MKISRILGYLAMAFAFAVVAVPVYFIIITSLKEHSDIYSDPITWWPNPLAPENYRYVFETVNFGQYLRNSIIITTVLTVIEVVLGVLTAYAFAFLEFPGRKVLFLFVIASLMVPSQITIISNYALVAELGWRNTFQGKLFRVVLPMSWPTLIAFILITVVTEWNQYLWPFLMSDTDAVAPLPIGLTQLQNNEGLSNWGPVMAGTVIATIPMIIVFILLQRHMIKGLTAGAVKG